MEKRLHLLLQEMGLTPAKFADAIGIQPSAVSHLLSGRNKPSFDLLSKILSHYSSVNPRWLILGEEPVYTGSLPEANLQDSPEINLTGKSSTINNIPISEKLIFPETDYSLLDPIPMQPEQAPPRQENLIDEIATDILSFNTHGSIRSVIIFFTDGTFECYRPSRE